MAGLALLGGCGTSAPRAGPVIAAAERALECDGPPATGGRGDYVDGGLESVRSGPEQALEDWLANEAWAFRLPVSGYRVESRDDDRVLLSYDVDGRTRIAFVAVAGITDVEDDTGWGIESWAGCDPSELPGEVTDALGIGVWQDAAGARVPTTKVQSYAGPEHCDWQDITFLQLGRGRDADTFLRDTAGAVADLLTTSYDADATLPRDATDTGLRRDGRQLWLAPDRRAAYLVDVSDPADVERWPAARRPIGCA